MMKNQSLFTLWLALVLVSMYACDADDQQDPQPNASSTGFTGTLPAGRSFTNIGIESNSDLAGVSSNLEGSYVYYSLSILDPDTKLRIVVDMPHVKYSDDHIIPNETILNDAAREYYSYETVKETLSVGNKTIASLETSDLTNAFRVLVMDENTYEGFITERMLDQTGSYLRVTELKESTETDPDLGSIKTLEVVFDLDIKVYSDKENYSQPEPLKGTLKMKYQQKL